jgi:putative endonuclease
VEDPLKNRVSLGKAGEDAAVRFLEKKHYRIVGRRFRMLRGEIDLIALERGTLVFIEVKARTGRDFGQPEESVTARKQEQIRKIAQAYLAKSRLANIPCRFDVVSVMFGEGRHPLVRHIQNAFE